MSATGRVLALALVLPLSAGPADEDRREAAVRLWTEGITDVSGLSALTPFSKLPYDDQDLNSVCAMKQTVVENALQASSDYLAHLKSAPEGQRNYAEIMKLHHQLGQIAMYRGEVRDAIANFEDAYKIAASLKLSYFEQSLQEKLGIAHLRRGEVENCAQHRNARSCILPISPEGRHKATAGSRRERSSRIP